MNKTIIKYGVFVILLIMSLGLLIILNRFEVYSKTSVNLIVLEEESCMAYVAYSNSFNPNVGDTIEITQTRGGDIRFILKEIHREPSNLILKLYPMDEKTKVRQKFGGDTFSPGYIFTGRVKLLEVIIKQFANAR
ncbi:MAG: hypothetical protein LIO93_12635 [Bacteroidales bacterium]|nr:hypothetical protein [Bacteroidales bacterium]